MLEAQHILVIGDSILDHKVFCDAIGLSLETPTLKTRLDKEEFSYGGAGNVVANLLALGNTVTYVTPVAQDSYADQYYNWDHADLRLIPLCCDGKNVVKSRYWISRGDQCYKYLQINQGTPYNDPELTINTLSEELTYEMFDSAILVDYRGGLFTDRDNTASMLSLLRKSNVRVYAASQVSDRKSQYELFAGADVICMNVSEAKSTMSTFEPTPDGLQNLSNLLDTRACVTRGEEGSMIQTASGALTAPGHPIATIDTCGAGDSFLAALVASREDLEFSNKWAAASTQQIGTNTPNLEEVLSWK